MENDQPNPFGHTHIDMCVCDSGTERRSIDNEINTEEIRRRRLDGFAPSNHRSFFRTSGPRTLRLAGER